MSLALLLACSGDDDLMRVEPGTVDIDVAPTAATSEVPNEAPCAGCDIVLITVCSLRRDHVGAYGELDIATPNIDRIAANAVRFEQAYSTSSFTLSSLSSVVTGRFGSSTGVLRWGTGLAEDVPTLPAVLGLYGFATGAFTVDAASGFRPEYGIQRGFQRISVIAPPRDTPDGRHGSGEIGPGGASAQPTAEWIMAQPTDRPLFAMFHSRSAHYPFVLSDDTAGSDPSGVLAALWRADMDQGSELPEPGMTGGREVTLGATSGPNDVRDVIWRAGSEGTEQLHGAYRDAVERMDLDIGVVLDAIEKRGRADKTVIVLLADHGESLNDHNEVLHGGAYFDGVVHIPLLVSIPGVEPGTNDALVSQVDLLPTLLELVGAVRPADIDGTSLMPLLRADVDSVRQTALIEGSPSLQPGDLIPGAVVSPPWVMMYQPTPCSGPIKPPPPPTPGGLPGQPPPALQPKGQHDEGNAVATHGEMKEVPEGQTPMHTCLFDLQADPGQTRDLAASQPDVVAQLMGRWEGYRSAVAGGSVPNELRLDPAFVELLQQTGYDFGQAP